MMIFITRLIRTDMSMDCGMTFTSRLFLLARWMILRGTWYS